MITTSDSFTTIDLGNYYAILPSDRHLFERYRNQGRTFTNVEPGFAYNSGTNHDFLTVNQLRELILEHIDPSFQPV